MKIEQRDITVRDLTKGYANNNTGAIGFDGLLNIRPAYQREFVYDIKQATAVISSIVKGMPLNTMYWYDTGDGEAYELIDGQQRTISICSYVNGDYAVDHRYFHNLIKDEQDVILDYALMVYVCSTGTTAEKLEWFETINIAGEKLTKQELRNATFTGPFLTDAKKRFSTVNGPAYMLANHIVRGAPIRQDYLETALKWASKGNIEAYMGQHQGDKDSTKLWDEFRKIVKWTDATFPTKRKEMKGLDWGALYYKNHSNKQDPVDLEKQIKELFLDDEVTKKAGAYTYLLQGDSKVLSIRAFTPSQVTKAFTKQAGVCPTCMKTFMQKEMEADHIDPWSQGGKTEESNLQMLCRKCNRRKSNK